MVMQESLMSRGIGHFRGREPAPEFLAGKIVKRVLVDLCMLVRRCRGA